MQKYKFSLKQDPYCKRESLKYVKPIPSREYIMQCLDKLGEPVKHEYLIKAFSLRSAVAKEALRRRLIAMARDGQLITNRRGSFMLADKASLVRGVVVGHKDGFGFLVTEDSEKDIFLSARQMRRVFHNDRVLVQIVGKDRRNRPEGVIVEVLERNTTQVVGRYFEESGIAFVEASNKNISQDVLIPEDEKGSAKHGQLVVVDITSYPTGRRQATGQIVEVLGDHMAPGMEIELATRAYNLPHTWSDQMLTEAAFFKPASTRKDMPVSKLKGRKDLRKLPLVTIDGSDAKDFDDAVCCERYPKGGWRLYVAIADVSHYVKPGTFLDNEAFTRGNSVYFPGVVVPMLPEVLSNELCSLKPQVDRLCMVCDMTIDKQGKVTRYSFYEAVMCSVARLTYQQVMDMLIGNRSDFPELLPNLKELQSLYQVLRQQREKRGAIEFETMETKIVFGEDRKIKSIVPVVRNEAHRMIEEYMLAANVCAAQFLLKEKIPALYRVHEGPNADKLASLNNFLGGLGLSLGGGDDPTPLDYMRLLREVKGRSDEHLIQTVVLRSMRQAVYDAENIGHFGLAYEAYGHFTSPIRRYPDLLTHRAIRHAIRGGSLADFYYDNNEIHNFGEHCSMTERRADDATYNAINWLKCEYMLDKVGKKFSGIISGVANFGIFVELKEIYVEGLVHITALDNDYYEFDANKHCLYGKRSGKRYRLGDAVQVQVARVDLDEIQIDFEIIL
ncbi:MAG: ribonuclease R [Gammaproteobacteria bacterium]|nr:ribonuclease R [Gammaproteobacteria bacterium]